MGSRVAVAGVVGAVTAGPVSFREAAPVQGPLEQSSVPGRVPGACHAAEPAEMLYPPAIRVYVSQRHTVPVCRRVTPRRDTGTARQAGKVNTKCPDAVSLVAYSSRSRERRRPGMCCTER